MDDRPTDFSDSGAISVNGQWATAVRFAADFEDAQLQRVALRFSNGRSEIASATLGASEARELLGERNLARIAKVGAKAGAGRAQGTGELRGKTLAFRQIALPGYEAAEPNVVEADQTVVRPEPWAVPQASNDPGTSDRGKVDGAAAPVPGAAAPASSGPPTAANVPAWVRERFIVVGKRYYFPDRTLAFADDDRRLRAETDNLEVVRSLVAIAKAREWNAVKVKGSAEFRRLVWREASGQGIAVDGYTPSDVERAELQRNLRPRPEAASTSRDAPLVTARADDVPSRARTVEPSDRAALTGKLLEFGAAPYRFDPKQGLSYYLKLQTVRGEQTLWGVDLERAIVESSTGVKVGDDVSIENLGSRPVTVKSLRRDADGKAIDERISTHRNRWLIEKTAYFEQRAERAGAFRNGQAARRELEDRYPDLTGAIIGLWLGEQFAERLIERPEDRERVVALVKERIAQALERGQAVDAPRLKEEVRERLQVIGDDFDEVGQRARSRSASRGARAERAVERDVPPQVLA